MDTDEERTRGTELKKSADELWEAQHELCSYSFLLRNLGAGPGEGSAEDLYGLGLSLDRIAGLVAKHAARIEKVGARWGEIP